MENKESLRNLGKQIREQLTKTQLISPSQCIMDYISKQDYYINASKIFVYIDFGTEIITTDFIKQSILDNKIVAVPVINKEKEMNFYRINSLENLIKTNFGLVQPDLKNHKFEIEQCDSQTLVIVPGLIFDKNKYRIGYGGGYYDKFLANNVYKKSVGICLKSQLVDKIDINEYDIPVNELVSM